MVELRVRLDAIDDAPVAAPARRAGYVDRAVALKTRDGLPPRTTARMAEVLARVRARAEAQGLDPDPATTLRTALIAGGSRARPRR